VDRFRTFLNLERGEEVPVGLLFLYLALALTTVIIAKTSSKALFLTRFSALYLPYVYIAVAVLIGFVISVYVRLSSRINQSALISGTLGFFIASALLLGWAMRMGWSPIAAIFYVWTSIFAALITTQVWTVANSVLNLRQAKRLFPLISSGGILGSMAGGLIAAASVKHIETENLVLLLIPFLVLSGAVVQILMRRYAHPHPETAGAGEFPKRVKGVGAALQDIGSSRYLRLIAALLAMSAVVTLFIDFQFNYVAQETFGSSKEQLATFFGSFYASLGAFSFLLLFLGGSRVIEKWGVRVTLLALPLALFGGTAALVAFPMKLWAGTMLKGSDAALRYSIDKSSIELLYLPVSSSLKAEVKAVIDIVVQRFADGLGALLLLAMTRGLGLGLRGVSVSNLVLIAIWLWVTLKMRREYVLAIRASLSERPALPKSTLRLVFGDRGSIATLQPMLKSKDEDVVLYAMELALSVGRKDWVPPSLLNHPSPKVRLKAMEIVPMTGPEILERARVDSDATVRAKAVARACELSQPERLEGALSQFLQSSDLKVRLAALIHLAHSGGPEEAETLKAQLDRIAGELNEASDEWQEVAEALGDMRRPAAVDFHVRLLHHPNRTVVKQAILSAGRAGHRELLPYLVRLLADARYASEARRALQDYGPRILGTLADILRDPAEDVEVRRNLPLVLAYMPHQAAVDLLLECLFDFDGLLRYRAIRALGKLRVIDPDLNFDPEKVSLRIREECEQTLWYQQAFAALYPDGDSQDLLAQLLKDKVVRGRERVFRLLALLLPPTTACASFLAMVEDDRLMKASAAEYLDNVLPGKLKRVVLPFIEPRQGLLRERRGIEAILRACLKSPDIILRECAADAIAKNRWPELSDLVSMGRQG
jgi:ATP/ADP translocase/HEAT repeat protein